MEVTLERFCDEQTQGTFGILRLDYMEFYTLERPWVNNEPNISCIPAGEYTCKRVLSPKFGVTFEVTNVVGRTHILFHAANTTDQLQGCIALGDDLSQLNGYWSVTDSRNSVKQFLNYLVSDEEFKLVITWKDHV